MNEIIWYTYTPTDTILVRGADEESSSLMSKFPPPAHTLSGAIRTAYLKQQNISFHDYIRGKAEAWVYKDIGKPSQEPPFSILGPLFEKDGEVFLPAPAHWYRLKNDMKDKSENSCFFDCCYAMERIGPIENIYSSRPIHVWAQGINGTIETLGSTWIRLAEVGKVNTKEELSIFKPSYFFNKEQRVGVALHDDRRVHNGRLYAFAHYRLVPGISLLFGLNRQGILEDECILNLGAERRFGLCRKINLTLDLHSKSNSLFMALSYIPCTEESNAALVCSEKIDYIGGWDLAKGFHKPMQGFYPAGTIFSRHIPNTIEI